MLSNRSIACVNLASSPGVAPELQSVLRALKLSQLPSVTRSWASVAGSGGLARQNIEILRRNILDSIKISLP